jgi:cytoskeletal protein CcmA (bactofilin family)
MARTPFGGKSHDAGSEPVFTPPAAAPGSAAGGGLTAFIDQGSEFEGKLSFKDTVRIDGRFRGEISSENTLIVGESGEVDASIISQNVMVSGAVVGNVSASTKVVLHKTARISGDVETACLVVEDGAVLNGQVKMGKGGGGSLKAIEGGGKERAAK